MARSKDDLSYDTMQPKRAPRQLDPKNRDPSFSWLDKPKGEAYKELSATVRRLVMFQQNRLWQNARFMSLYCNEDFLQPFYSGGAGAGSGSNGSGGGAGARMSSMPRQTANLIKAYTDTLAGKLVQSNSRVQAATIMGDWSTWKLTRKIDRMLDAEWTKGNLWYECSRVVIDTLNTGTGFLYVGEEYDDPCIRFERWYPNEMFFDPLDAAYGCPTVLFRMRYMKRENAMAIWGKDPKKAEIIKNAAVGAAPTFAWAPYQPGMIEVMEAWALPVGDRKGRHVLTFSSGSMVDEEWKSSMFPVAIFRASDLPLGGYGQGFIAHTGATQVELNRILNIMAKSANLGFAPYWTVSGGAEVSIKQLNNAEGHIVTSTGPEPKWNANKPFHEAAPAYVEQLSGLIRMGYGMNDMEAAGSMPLNRLDSDPALVQAQDIWAARHTILLKNWSETFFLDVAHRTLDCAKRIAEANGSYPVVATKQGRAWGMDWKDFVKLDKEKYRLTLASGSALPLTLAARKKMAIEMRDAGLITPERALQMLQGNPDLEAATADVAAFENNADYLIEQLFDGKMPTVSELQDKDALLMRVRQAGLQAQEYDAPDEILLNFETFAAQLTLDTTAAKQMAQAMMSPPAQGAANGQSASPVLAPTDQRTL